MSSDYEKLKKLYDQIDELITMDINDSEFIYSFVTWNTSCMGFLSRKYGETSPEYSSYKMLISQLPNEQPPDYSRNKFIMQTRILPLIKRIFENLLEDLKESKTMINNDAKNVFIVHGHDGELLNKISSLIYKVGIHPIILKNEIDNSMTIIEKLEEYGDTAKVAIILFTPDDVGKCKTDNEEERARQNVVFEADYFMALLGRKNTLVIKSGNVKLPGDIDGVIYTDKNDEMKLVKELRAKLNANGFNVSLDDLLK